MKSSAWIFFPLLILLIAGVLLYPNFAERELELVIHPESKKLSKEESDKLINNFTTRWKNDYNLSGKYKIEPSPEEGLPANDKFLVTGRFITSAQINQISL